jgi:IS5 family transposase
VATEAADRISFRLFLNLNINKKPPNDTTPVRFRKLHVHMENIIGFELIGGGIMIIINGNGFMGHWRK